MGCEFDGAVYGKPREMQEARRRKHLELVSGGTNFTRAAEAEDNRQPAPAPRGAGEAERAFRDADRRVGGRGLVSGRYIRR